MQQTTLGKLQLYFALNKKGSRLIYSSFLSEVEMYYYNCNNLKIQITHSIVIFINKYFETMYLLHRYPFFHSTEYKKNPVLVSAYLNNELDIKV